MVLSFGEWAVEGEASLAVAADGSLLIGASSYAPSLEVPDATDFRRKIIVRLTPAGALDASFGTGGVIHDNNGIYVYDLAALPDGSVVTGAYGAGGLALLKYKPDGTLDTSFGDGGRVSVAPVKSGGYDSTFAPLADGTFRFAQVSELGWHAATYGADGKPVDESKSAEPPPSGRAPGRPVPRATGGCWRCR